MRPLAALPEAILARLRGVLADIDDTLTTGGRLTAEAYCAMERLEAAGLAVVPVTGRPAGWCDHIARMWPVTAVVGENGAFWFRYDRGLRRMHRWFARDAATRAHDRTRLTAVGERILAEVAGTAIAADLRYREADLAIDFCEDVAPLPQSSILRIVEIMRSAGLTAKTSSIHVNGWFGDYDKRTTALALLDSAFGIGAERARGEFAYVGDSPNDEPMFAFFECSVGVANVRDFEHSLASPPAWVTEARAGAGFAELAKRVLAARGLG